MKPNKNQLIAIVTGGARGIGLAIATRLVQEKFYVIIADVDDNQGLWAVQQLGENLVHFIKCDVGDEKQVSQLFQTLSPYASQLKVLVNNAGIIRDHVIWKMSIEEFDEVIRVNLRGTWLMCREAARIMRENRQGRIINISSRAWLGNPGQTNYSASKAGIVGLTRALALELGKYNVTVNAIAPGLIDTDLTR
ncbi:MAG: SDR family oxidoreductase, partial [Calditrichaeota bacterium]